MMSIERMLVGAICFCTVLSGAAYAETPDHVADVDPCAQLEGGPKRAFGLYLPRHDREVPIYLPAAWQDGIAGLGGGLEDVLGLLVRPGDFKVELLSQDAEVELGSYLILAFAAHPHPDTIGPYEIDRSGQSFVEGPFGLYRTEGLVEEEPHVEYRDEPAEDSSMYILCRPWLPAEFHTCDMIIPGDEVDMKISLNSRELPNWKLHRDRAIKFRDCAMSAA